MSTYDNIPKLLIQAAALQCPPRRLLTQHTDSVRIRPIIDDGTMSMHVDDDARLTGTSHSLLSEAVRPNYCDIIFCFDLIEWENSDEQNEEGGLAQTPH